MIAVALIAIAIGLARFTYVAMIYHRKAVDHAVLERRCLDMARAELALAERHRGEFEERRRRARKESEEYRATSRNRLLKYQDGSEEVARKIAARLSELERYVAEEKTRWDRMAEENRVRLAERVAEAERSEAFARYHAQMRRRYERAVWRPWEAVRTERPPSLNAQ